MMLDMASGAATDAIVSLTDATVLGVENVDAEVGQLPILDAEFEIVAEFLAGEPQWNDALRKRGVDPTKTVAVPLSAGTYDNPNEAGRRIIRSFAFVQDHEKDLPWAHPVDGLCAYVDIINREIVDLVDYRIFDVPAESGNFDTPEVAGPPMEGLKPIEITQPEGPSFTVDGEHIEWTNWSLDISYDQREGLILRKLTYQGRDVMYRASINEMVVPYGDPSPNRYWQNYFDTGEYVFGRYANELTLGCDCLGEIYYFDATLADEQGSPRTISNAVCMHEEDYGTLWKHTDIFTGMSEVRRQRRLVISFFTTVGNYDYGFYWYLYLDGTIELEAKLTGIAFTAAYPEEGSDYQSLVAPGLGLRTTSICSVHGWTWRWTVCATPSRRSRRRECPWARVIRGATRSPSPRPGSGRRPTVPAMPTRPPAGPGTFSTPRRPAEWAIIPPMRCTPSRPRPCWPTPHRRSPGAPHSPPNSCG